MTEQRYDEVSAEWIELVAPDDEPEDAPCALCTAGGLREPPDLELAPDDLVVVDRLRTTDRARALALGPRPPTPTPAIRAAELVRWSDDHRETLGRLPLPRLEHVVDVLADRYAALANAADVSYVLIHDPGARRGAPDHPHLAIDGFSALPPVAERQFGSARDFLAGTETCLACDLAARELADEVRMIGRNRSFVAYCPFASPWEGLVRIQPRRHAASLLDLSQPEREALAALMGAVLRAHGEVVPHPGRPALAVHQAPTDDQEWLAMSHLRIDIVPPEHAHANQRGRSLAGAVGYHRNRGTPEQRARQLRPLVQEQHDGSTASPAEG